jgi:hypothetical protein
VNQSTVGPLAYPFGLNSDIRSPKNTFPDRIEQTIRVFCVCPTIAPSRALVGQCLYLVNTHAKRFSLIDPH